ncbi:hypothetical protein GCM10023176_56930 [Micromonospora coerulea]|uniref:Uncharacterized protein n=1 Tax=Micromonospora coerulea TaxID=47856 RepID=A0ABP8T0Z9_9ACTN
MVAGDGLLDVFGEVVPQMPPVGHLDSLGRTGAGALGVGVGAISADDLHGRMLCQPGGEGGRFPIG